MLKIKDNVSIETLKQFGFDGFKNYQLDDIGSQIYIVDNKICLEFDFCAINEDCAKRAMELIFELTKANLIEKN